MIVTPFGDLDFNDKSSLEPWIAAHDQRHRTYRLALSSLGSFIQPAPLATTPNADWFGRHLLTHLSMLKVIPSDSSYVTLSLDVAGWTNESQFNDWHNTHNLIHQRLDNAFGIQ